MIDYIRGLIVDRETDAIVIENHDIGYRVYTANPFAFEDQAFVYIFDHIREDGRTLYGFSTREEQKLFRRLLDVNGIGPKSAMAILASTSVKSLIIAIAKEDLSALSKLPGIGRKTAQRMILDIKDGLAERIIGGRLPADWTADLSTTSANSKGTYENEKTISGVPIQWLEAKSALIGLGYSEQELSAVWNGLKERQQLDPLPTTEQWIKWALQQFAINR